MKNSKETLDKMGFQPPLKLATKDEKGIVRGTGPHIVTVKSDRIVKGTDYEGKEQYEVELTLEESGELKTYNFPVKGDDGKPHYLLVRFGDIEPEEQVVMEFK